MKLPYGYVLINEEIVVHEEKADAVCIHRTSSSICTEF